VASPSRALSSPSLSFARAPSLIQLGDFSILISLASSVVLFPCLVVSLSIVSSFFSFFSFSRLFCVYWYDDVKSNSLGYVVEKRVIWYGRRSLRAYSQMCELESPRRQASGTDQRSRDESIPVSIRPTFPSRPCRLIRIRGFGPPYTSAHQLKFKKKTTCNFLFVHLCLDC
jgi:hypothetical protein